LSGKSAIAYVVIAHTRGDTISQPKRFAFRPVSRPFMGNLMKAQIVISYVFLRFFATRTGYAIRA